MSRCVLITGANRGIGLEFVKQLLARGDQVLATCREPEKATALNALAQQATGRLKLYPLEVDDAESIANLRNELADEPIDLLINNAGVYGPRQFKDPTCDAQSWLKVLAVNTVAPYQVASALLDNLKRGDQAKIVNITSRMGSIADNDSGGAPIYRSSKAGLNAAMKSMAIDLADSGISVLLLHPGWVKTDMGGENALIDSETSVSGMLAVVDRAESENLSGKFFHCDGSELPW